MITLRRSCGQEAPFLESSSQYLTNKDLYLDIIAPNQQQQIKQRWEAGKVQLYW